MREPRRSDVAARRLSLHIVAKLWFNLLVCNMPANGIPLSLIAQRSKEVVNVFMQKASSAGLAAAVAIALASAPAVAAPIVLNPNFTINDTASDNAYNGGKPFYVQNWSPTGYASNSSTDTPQFDNGKPGSQTVVGFLSGLSSLSQVVQGFITGRTYRVSVGANARAGVSTRPTFQISADNVQVYAPTLLTAVDPAGTFRTAFTAIQSDTFVAANTFVTIKFANAAGSDANASTLLSAVSLSQVPEPVSLAILGIGLLGIGIARRCPSRPATSNTGSHSMPRPRLGQMARPALPAILGYLALSSIGIGSAKADAFSLSYEAAKVQSANTTALCARAGAGPCTIGVENFDTRSSNTTFTTNIGTGGTITGTYNATQAGVSPADQYGGAGGTGKYISAPSNQSYSVALSTTLATGLDYFGIWISALDAGNQLAFYKGTTLLYSFTPSTLIAAVGSCSGTNAYCGNPNPQFANLNTGEPYAFVNFLDTNGTFDKVTFVQGAGGGYEADNHTVGYATAQSGVNIPIDEPASLALLALALVGLNAIRPRRPNPSCKSPDAPCLAHS